MYGTNYVYHPVTGYDDNSFITSLPVITNNRLLRAESTGTRKLS